MARRTHPARGIGTVTDLLRFVRRQVGHVEHGGPDGRSGNMTKYGDAYGLNGYPWCSMFVWFCFFKALTINLRDLVSSSYASCAEAVAGWKRKHRFHYGVAGMRPGDITFYAFAGDGHPDHTGICVRVDANGHHTIEGNTSPQGGYGSQRDGGGVYKRLRPDSEFLGYARPNLRYDLGTRIRHAAAKGARKLPTFTPGDKRIRGVKRLQRLLNKAGVRINGKPLDVDGEYGPLTAKAVRDFQTKRHLHVDGVAGPATLKEIKW